MYVQLILAYPERKRMLIRLPPQSRDNNILDIRRRSSLVHLPVTTSIIIYISYIVYIYMMMMMDDDNGDLSDRRVWVGNSG